MGLGEVGRCGVGQRCELGCSRFKEGSEVPAQACAPEREDCLCRETSPSSLAHSWPWAGGVAGGGLDVLVKGGAFGRCLESHPESVPFSFSVLQIVAQDSWESSFFPKFKPSEGIPQRSSG